jgi:hypothetical protein
MAYIGYFDELILSAGPQVEAVIEASDVLLNSAAFRKVGVVREESDRRPEEHTFHSCWRSF